MELEYLIDGHDRRVARKINGKVVTRYIWQDQLRIAAELDPSGKIRQQYVYADGVNSPDYMVYQGRKYLFVKDHRGSINLVVDAVSGEIKQRMVYSEFGEVTEDTNPGFQPFGFAGGLYDPETKLVRFGARDYDSRIGRWLSKDPIRFEGGDTNLYGYVLQDPVNFTDPKGLQRPEDPEFYDKMREQGEVAMTVMDAYLEYSKNQKAKAANEAYNLDACKATTADNAQNVQQYFNLPH